MAVPRAIYDDSSRPEREDRHDGEAEEEVDPPVVQCGHGGYVICLVTLVYV